MYGDWRDIRDAVQTADPDWNSRPNDERQKLWAFVEGALKAYAPLHITCLGCGARLLARSAYRCADCGTHYCDRCIRPHFAATEPATRHAGFAPEARATTQSNLSAEGVRDADEVSGQPTDPNTSDSGAST